MCMRETDRQTETERDCMYVYERESEREGSAFANILPSTGHENDIFQPKAGKCLGCTSYFSPFKCRFVA